MAHRSKHVAWTMLLVPGCIIGTWPTPEGSDTDLPNEQTIMEELCDGVDNDADGAIDEGCETCGSADVRGCIGVDGNGLCGVGVQDCRRGYWSACGNLGEPRSAPVDPSIAIVSAVPGSITRGGTEVVRVVVEATAVCPGVRVWQVETSLLASTPVMRIKAIARDDGEPPDVTARDGEFVSELVNPFGVGVAAQTLTLRAAAVINGVHVEATAPVELEEL